MPAVTPSASEAAYYNELLSEARRAARESEENAGKEIERVEKNNEEDIAWVEDANRANLDKMREKSNETVENVKKQSNDALAAERESAHIEIKRLKNNTYDQFGKYREQDIQDQKIALEKLKNNYEGTIAQEKTANVLLRDGTNEKIAQVHRDSNRDIEKITELARKTAEESFRSSIDAEKIKSSELEKKIADSNSSHNRELQSEIGFIKEQQHAVDEAYKAQKHKDFMSRTGDDHRVEQLIQDIQENSKKDIATANRRHAETTSELTRQMTDILSAPREFADAKAAGRTEAIREFENDVHLASSRSQAAHDGEIKKAKDQAKHDQDHYLASSQALARDKDRAAAALMQDATARAKSREDALNKNFQTETASLKRHMTEGDELNFKRNAQFQSDATARAEATVDKQRETFQKDLSRTRTEKDADNKFLRDQLIQARTSTDPGSISPGAEAAIREHALKQYEGEISEEKKRRISEGDRLLASYGNRFNELKENLEWRERKQLGAATNERDMDRASFNSFIFEMDQSLKDKNRERDGMHAKELEKIERTYSKLLRDQKLQFEQQLETVDQNNRMKLMQIQQEAENQARLEAREHNNRLYATIHSQERKLQEERDTIQAQLEEVKRLRQKEADGFIKNQTDALETQARFYTNQIAQLKGQYEDRETKVTRNYEDQIDAIKRRASRAAKQES